MHEDTGSWLNMRPARLARVAGPGTDITAKLPSSPCLRLGDWCWAIADREVEVQIGGGSDVENGVVDSPGRGISETIFRRSPSPQPTHASRRLHRVKWWPLRERKFLHRFLRHFICNTKPRRHACEPVDGPALPPSRLRHKAFEERVPSIPVGMSCRCCATRCFELAYGE